MKEYTVNSGYGWHAERCGVRQAEQLSRLGF